MNIKHKIGEKYGFLTLVEIQKDGWLCQCDCGRTTKQRISHLTRSKVVSCGCKKFFAGNRNHNYRGCVHLSGNHFYGIKIHAKRRNISFDLTIEQCWCLYLEQAGKCALTGQDIVFRVNESKRSKTKKTASLDRIDSSKGYTIDNVQWVHIDLQYMKYTFSQEKFLDLCKQVVAYHNLGSKM